MNAKEKFKKDYSVYRILLNREGGYPVWERWGYNIDILALDCDLNLREKLYWNHDNRMCHFVKKVRLP